MINAKSPKRHRLPLRIAPLTMNQILELPRQIPSPETPSVLPTGRNRALAKPYWSLLAATALTVSTIALLFQPWLEASGQNGNIHVTAFGDISGVMNGSSRWISDDVTVFAASTCWATFACFAAVAAFCGVVIRLRRPGNTAVWIVLGATVAVAASVLFELYYLTSRTPELRSVTNAPLFMATNQASSGISSAGLTTDARVAGITALAATCCAALALLRGRTGQTPAPVAIPNGGTFPTATTEIQSDLATAGAIHEGMANSTWSDLLAEELSSPTSPDPVAQTR